MMFAQVMQGQVSDAGRVKAALDQWAQELGPTATGWLGTTAGVTADGRFIAVVRFESEEAARRSSDRAEQDQWFQRTAQLFSSPPTFHDSTDVTLDIVGDPDRAGFVQVMQGRGSNPDRARELMTAGSAEWAAFRPEVLGSAAAQYDDGAYTMTIYFTSEAEARAGEQKEPPPELKAQMEEMNKISVGTPEFFDLTDPWLYAPR